MKAILFTLLITGTEPEITYKFVATGAEKLSWEECFSTAYSINEFSDVKTGEVTAVCFPYTDQDIKEINERSRQHS